MDKKQIIENAIFEFVNSGNVSEIKRSLVEGTQVDCLDDSGMTPLQHASYKGNLEVCKLLLRQGANVNSNLHKQGYTALMFGALSGNKEVVRFLLENGANPDVENSVHRTASQMAAFVGRHEIVSLINAFFSRQEIEYFCQIDSKTGLKIIETGSKIVGIEFLEKDIPEPLLPRRLVQPLYVYCTAANLNPVRLAIILGQNPELLGLTNQAHTNKTCDKDAGVAGNPKNKSHDNKNESKESVETGIGCKNELMGYTNKGISDKKNSPSNFPIQIRIVKVLEKLCERQVKRKEADESMALRLHFLKVILEETLRWKEKYEKEVTKPGKVGLEKAEKSEGKNTDDVSTENETVLSDEANELKFKIINKSKKETKVENEKNIYYKAKGEPQTIDTDSIDLTFKDDTTKDEPYGNTDSRSKPNQIISDRWFESWLKFLLKRRGSDDNFPINQEKLVRETLKTFPYPEMPILQQCVRSIASNKLKEKLDAINVFKSFLEGQRMPSEEDKRCIACSQYQAKTCQACQSVHYCDRICQKIHWQTGHKTECKALGKARLKWLAREKGAREIERDKNVGADEGRDYGEEANGKRNKENVDGEIDVDDNGESGYEEIMEEKKSEANEGLRRRMGKKVDLFE